MKPPPGHPVGINGIKIRNDNLFFTNKFQFTFNRIPIRTNGSAVRPAQVVVENGLCDDFIFDTMGNAFVTTNADNTLQMITPEGAVTVVVGNLNSTQLVGPTAVQFGRTHQDKSTLYITTNGGISGPVNGTFTEGGEVVAVDLQPTERGFV
jgi:hypothetical protein